MMRKEIFKNITLVTLIFISVLLFSKIWFGEYLIYNKDILLGGRQEVQMMAVEGIIMPKRIVITGNDKRCCILKGTEEYNKCYSVIKEFFGMFADEAAKFEPADPSEWKAALKSKSVLLDYGSVCSSSVLSKITMQLPEGEIREIVIAPGNSVVSKPLVYIKNAAGDDIYKTELSTGYGGVNGLVETYLSNENVNNLPFAFELGFDRVRTVNDELSQNTLLDSNIIIGLKETAVPEINVLKSGKISGAEQKTVDELLSMFDFNPPSTGRYIEKDDTYVFVDSKATLKIHSQGYIEYSAERGGIPLTDSNTDEKNTVSRSVETMYSLVRGISKIFNLPEQQIQIYSDITKSITGDATVYMDYYFNGIPVIINSGDKAEHIISFKVKNGMITGFKQYLYGFENSGAETVVTSMVSAINRLNEKFENTSMTVSDIYSAYVCGENGTQVKWCAKKQDNDIIEIID